MTILRCEDFMCEFQEIPNCEFDPTGKEQNSTIIDETTTTEKSISDKINFSPLASMLAIYFGLLLNKQSLRL